MHKPEFVRENKTHKILWEFVMQTDPQISAKKNKVLIFKNLSIVDLAVLKDHRLKIKESEKLNIYLDLTRCGT